MSLVPASFPGCCALCGVPVIGVADWVAYPAIVIRAACKAGLPDHVAARVLPRLRIARVRQPLWFILAPTRPLPKPFLRLVRDECGPQVEKELLSIHACLTKDPNLNGFERIQSRIEKIVTDPGRGQRLIALLAKEACTRDSDLVPEWVLEVGHSRDDLHLCRDCVECLDGHLRHFEIRRFYGRNKREAMALARAAEVSLGAILDLCVTRPASRETCIGVGREIAQAIAAARKRIPPEALDVGDPGVLEQAAQGQVEVRGITWSRARAQFDRSVPFGSTIESRKRLGGPWGPRPHMIGVWVVTYTAPFRVGISYCLPLELDVVYAPQATSESRPR